jgi:hypothetical protein
LAGVLAVAALALGACTGSKPNEGTASPGARDRSLTLTYLEGSTLHRVEVSSGKSQRAARLPSPDVWAAPEGAWLAAVVDARPRPGDSDFARYPSLRLVDEASGRSRPLGPGLTPLWSPSGDRLAWLRPVEERACFGEACAGSVEVVSAEVPGGRPRRLLGPGRWGLLAWAGDRLLVSRRADLRSIMAVAPDGRVRTLPLPPSEVWGATPDGRWLVRSARDGVDFLPLTPGPEAFGVALGGVLAEGTWSPSGERLAAIQLKSTAGGVPRSRVVLISTRARALRPLRGSAGAAGNVLWSPDETRVAFARTAGRRAGRLEAVVCEVATGACRTLMSWVRGVVLLRLG